MTGNLALGEIYAGGRHLATYNTALGMTLLHPFRLVGDGTCEVALQRDGG
jgi:hypothetical protein